ncbi:GSCOCG00010434001-RA-CDS, partial [Cotesia congregata]
PGCRSIVRSGLLKRNVPEDTIDIMIASLSENSIKQYDVCLKKWFHYCQEKGIDLYEASVSEVLEFLTNLFKNSSQCGSLNSCRAALALVITEKISEDERIRRFFKGVFRLRPPLPKYDVTWDTSIVLDALAKWYPNEELSLEELTRKCVTLLALGTAHRVQTLSKINIDNIEVKLKEILIKIPDMIKTSRIGAKQPLLCLPFFKEKLEICPGTALTAYIRRIKDLRSTKDLFISYRKPFGTVTTQTISRWIKLTLKDSGLDVTTFSAHSTRHASTSKAHKLGVNIDEIRKTAGWSGTSNTFGKFYNR